MKIELTKKEADYLRMLVNDLIKDFCKKRMFGWTLGRLTSHIDTLNFLKQLRDKLDEALVKEAE